MRLHGLERASRAVPRASAFLLAAVLGLAVTLAQAPAGRADQAQDDGRGMPAGAPVVVELFTSQGCSSCPPADDLLAELAHRPDIIALSLHVDYWDYIGWKDPYGSPLMTERQRRYAEELGLRYVYTPQMVIDGRTDVVGMRRGEVLDAIETAARKRKAVAVNFVPSDGGKVVIPAGHAPDSGATIWLAVYDEGYETAVSRGENAGRTVRNANVVRSLERLGTWMGQRLEIPLNLDSAAARGNYGCAVIVQQGRNGPILGAGRMILDDLR